VQGIREKAEGKRQKEKRETLLLTGNRQPATGNRQLTTGNWKLTVI